MEGILEHIENGKLLVRFSKEIYEKDALLAAAYVFSGSCYVLIKSIGANEFGVFFELKSKDDPSSLQAIARNFCNEALNQQTRLSLEKRYGNIRELIVSHAFSPLKDLEGRVNKK